ncbi:MAG: glutaredoxin [Candidatus Altiarchaeota archaeon]|nr:glutaredoxin [Candidatus Altiarchaeota archaeon]
MLDDKNKTVVKEILSTLKNEVEILFFISKTCEYCPQERELLNQISEVSKVKISELDLNSDEAKKYEVTEAPTLIFSKNPNIRIMGLPSGHEFRNFLDTILMIDSQETKLGDDVKAELKKIDKKVDIKVFVTPTCPYCPTAVFTAHQFALENSKVISTMVEATEFPKLAQKHGVMSVPKTIVNDKIGWEGAAPPNVSLKKLMELL